MDRTDHVWIHNNCLIFVIFFCLGYWYCFFHSVNCLMVIFCKCVGIYIYYQCVILVVLSCFYIYKKIENFSFVLDQKYSRPICRDHLALELIQVERALCEAVNKYYEAPMFVADSRWCGHKELWGSLLTAIPDSAHEGAYGYYAVTQVRSAEYLV